MVVNFNVPGYHSEHSVTDEYKINVLAQFLAGYDEATWNKLRPDRKRTYNRAASTVLFQWEELKELMGTKGWQTELKS